MVDVTQKDTRIVYGSVCSWWDNIYKVTKTNTVPSIPCCPHCGGPLFEMPDLTTWYSAVEEYARDHPGYREFIDWLRGKCFKGGYPEAIAVYEKETGTTIRMGSLNS